MRIKDSTELHPIVNREKNLKIIINGKDVQAFEGELVSTVLQSEGISVFNFKHKTGKPAGIYCGMGVCYECLVTIDGVSNIRACQTFVKDGMVINTGDQVKP